MLLTLTTTYQPATDLGYLLAKNPARCQTFELSFGQAHVMYPTASHDRCSAALLVDIDPVGLVRGARGGEGFGGTLCHYVNDRPYVASSFLSVAIARVFASALNGASRDRPELAAQAIPLRAELSVVQCHPGEAFLRSLFEPLGYAVTATRLPLDEMFPEWGESPYYTMSIEATCRLQDLLSHLYVLLPVLDNEKHYWVGADEIEKLMAKGEGWLAAHPEREVIVRRYLRRKQSLVREAMARIVAAEEPDPELQQRQDGDEEVLEQRISLNEQRMGAALAVLKESGARSVLDLGCGEGRLLAMLLRERQFERIVGVDVAYRPLEIARDRLDLDRMAPAARARIEIVQGALTYRDARFAGFDAACAIEVIEHLDQSRLPAFERVVFEFARPATMVVTTPNVEHNVRFETLPAGRFRHRDHRFEWTRAEFQAWAHSVCERYGYSVRFLPVGPEDPEVGPATQMGVFTR